MAFLMLLIMATGIISYEQLSRNEDPAFTIKTAVVSAQWPGANLSDTVNLVTDTLEKSFRKSRGLTMSRVRRTPGAALFY